MPWSIRHVLTRIAFAAALASVAPHPAVFAQERDRGKIPDKYKWNLADIYPSEEAWREAKDRLVAEIPKLRKLPREAWLLGGATGGRAGTALAAEQGGRAALRLRQHAVGPGHAGQQVPGDAAGDDSGRRATRRRGRLHRAGNPQGRQGHHRQVRGRGTAPASLIGCTWTTSSGAVPTRRATRRRSCWRTRRS